MSHEPRTSQGRPVPDHEINRLARQAEAGYDPAAFRRSGGRDRRSSFGHSLLIHAQWMSEE